MKSRLNTKNTKGSKESYKRLNIQTIKGAIARAGNIFPTRIFLISSKLEIANPNKITPPVAVSSFIMEGVTIAFNCAAKRLMPP